MGVVTDTDILARLIETDPALGPVIAEARDVGMHDGHIVEVIARIVAQECQRRFGYPPQSLVGHLAQHGDKPA